MAVGWGLKPILIFDSSETEFLLLHKNLPLRRARHDATEAVDRRLRVAATMPTRTAADSPSDRDDLILGEFPRTLDERFRVALPNELVAALRAEAGRCVLAKERPGCLSLWEAAAWKRRTEPGLDLIRAKLRAGKLAERPEQLQQLSRLLSTRHVDVQVAERGRLLIPDGFRSFLRAQAGGEVMLIGAGVCV